MTAPLHPELRCGIVLRTDENACHVISHDETTSVRFAPMFPVPRVERVLPGHLVAIASAPGRPDAVVWRWYDAVILGAEIDSVRLWEPAHGEVLATPRRRRHHSRGARSYLSMGLPGAEWWLAGPAVNVAEQADVELDEVDRFYTQADLWPIVFSADV